MPVCKAASLLGEDIDDEIEVEIGDTMKRNRNRQMKILSVVTVKMLGIFPAAHSDFNWQCRLLHFFLSAGMEYIKSQLEDLLHKQLVGKHFPSYSGGFSSSVRRDGALLFPRAMREVLKMKQTHSSARDNDRE